MRIFTTLLRPTGGRAEVAGHDVLTQPREVRARIGLLGQHAALDEDLNTPQALAELARIAGEARKASDETSRKEAKSALLGAGLALGLLQQAPEAWFARGVAGDTDADDLEAVRGSVEHYIPKAKGYEFTEELIQHANAICVEGTPLCPQCPLKSDCPTGQELLAKGKAKDAKPKPKSR